MSNPSRAAISDFLATDANKATYSPQTLDAMKISGQIAADAGMRSLEAEIRRLSASTGQPVADFRALIAQGRSDILAHLIESNRAVDIRVAETAAADRARYFSYLNSAQGARWGFLGPATESVANLIAGTPGLAGSG